MKRLLVAAVLCLPVPGGDPRAGIRYAWRHRAIDYASVPGRGSADQSAQALRRVGRRQGRYDKEGAHRKKQAAIDFRNNTEFFCIKTGFEEIDP